jgi:nucleoside-diphosphate-sugar epimerase
MKMNILVIGGGGHVSGAVVWTALSKKHKVWTVTRGQRPLQQGVISLIADRHDVKAMKEIIGQQGVIWDLVVDCICYEPADMLQDIELFRDRARQFVFVSTDFVYDPALRRFPQPEDTEYYVTDCESSMSYGGKKRRCELDLINGDTGGMEWTILRPCHIYGPTSQLGCLPMHGRDPELIKKLREGVPLKLVGGGHFLQQPIFVDDLGRTIVSVGGNKKACGKIFNMAGPDIIESRQYYQIIADILEVGLDIEEISVTSYLAENPGGRPFMCHRIYDLGALRAAGLVVPLTSIEDGLRLHVEGLLQLQK